MYYSGVLPGNGASVYLESSMDHARIVIDGGDYAREKDGLNVVVYDYESESVIDTACFDLAFPDRWQARAGIDIEKQGSDLIITADQLAEEYKTTDEDSSVRGVLWDGAHFEEPVELEFTGDGIGTYTAHFNADGYDTQDLYLELFMYYDKTKVESRIMDWHGSIDYVKGSFAEYINMLSEKKQDKLIIISTKDDSGRKLSASEADALRKLGVTRMLEPNDTDCAFAVITPDGVYEECSSENLSYNTEYAGMEIGLASSSWPNEFYSSVVVNGQELSRNEEGFNVIVIDLKTGNVDDVMTYNVWKDEPYRIER